jgi:hypothetical protein
LSSFASPKLGDSKRSTATATQVVLVPLCDSPSLPSLSLLLAQGTTPTAVCFQQDLLDRAKRTEDEWLPAALDQIRLVTAAKEHAPLSAVVLAYSANQALSSSTIAACVRAGASGVLKPPYDLETARLVRRMTRAALSGRISSVVGLPLANDPSSPTLEDDIRVVLPPVALPLGDGEHETERALSSHRRGMSGQWDALSSSSGSIPPPITPLTANLPRFDTKRPTGPIHSAGIAPEPTSPALRRRSVDVGGLTVAMNRAQQAFEASAGQDVSVEHQEADMHLAELLGTMYHQTCQTIDVQMEEYAK